MNKKFITYTQAKLKCEKRSDVCDYLGITNNTSSKYERKNDLNNTEIFGLIKKSRRSAVQNSINVITEYYPIELTRLRENHDFIDAKRDPNHTKLKNELNKSFGVYVFYDSSGRAIYVGKAVRQSLYSEMRSAFNRFRNEVKDTMVIIRSAHTKNKMKIVKFNKSIKRHRVTISDVSAYFSAFRIDKNLISTIEAIMIRAFANNLTNSKIENL